MMRYNGVFSSNDQKINNFFQFYGVFPFKFQLSDFSELLPSRELEDSEVTVSAEVGDMIWNILQGGFSKTRLLDSKLRLKFLGNSPHILRPAMPFKFYVSFFCLYFISKFITSMYSRI